MSRSGLLCAGQNRFEPFKTGLWPSFRRSGLVCSGLMRFYPVWSGLIRFDLVSSGQNRF
ncbi:hypothetical protein CPC698_1497 [Chlamydia psittaci C6/98]|nr:hypothetical protein CP08DC60_1269 [Chlamydia psittaci 08DC60]EPP32834.1 hypothetical protein CPC698_1497 [Chlamydia psittaci C6/98]